MTVKNSLLYIYVPYCIINQTQNKQKGMTTKMDFEDMIKENDTYIYKKCQLCKVDFTSATSILYHFAMTLETSNCLTQREADCYLTLTDSVLFEIAHSAEQKEYELEVICAYKNVYQAYSRYLSKICEMRCEKNLKELYEFII